jgi:hypothetical protein
MLRFIGLAAAMLLTVTQAEALMPPWVYRDARANAPYHVQIAVSRVMEPAQTPGACAVAGDVVEAFRDATGKLPKGTPVSFPVSCMRPGDKVPIGGTMWTTVENLKQARFVEVYLVAAGQGYTSALDQMRIIAAPSESPQFPVD